MLSSCAARLVLLASFVGGPALIVACGGTIDGESPGDESTGTREEATRRSSSDGGGGGAETDACTAAAVCDPSDEQVASESECASDVSCYSRTVCGTTIWCASTGTQCAAVPTCPSGSIEVKDCPSNADCESVTVCGSTIQCLKGCEGPQPICDAGDTQVSSSSACLQDDAVCYSRSTCGYTIWCTGPAD